MTLLSSGLVDPSIEPHRDKADHGEANDPDDSRNKSSAVLRRHCSAGVVRIIWHPESSDLSPPDDDGRPDWSEATALEKIGEGERRLSIARAWLPPKLDASNEGGP